MLGTSVARRRELRIGLTLIEGARSSWCKHPDESQVNIFPRQIFDITASVQVRRCVVDVLQH